MLAVARALADTAEARPGCHPGRAEARQPRASNEANQVVREAARGAEQRTFQEEVPGGVVGRPVGADGA